MPRAKPKPVVCENKEPHSAHGDCQGYVSPIRVDDDVTDLNRLWIPLAPLRMEIAKLVKEGNNEYPLGELILIIRGILRKEEENGTI